MHTMTTKLPEGGEARIHHNGDWSGDAHVSWDDADGHHEVKLPSAVLLAVSKDAAKDMVRDAVTTALERL